MFEKMFENHDKHIDLVDKRFPVNCWCHVNTSNVQHNSLPHIIVRNRCDSKGATNQHKLSRRHWPVPPMKFARTLAHRAQMFALPIFCIQTIFMHVNLCTCIYIEIYLYVKYDI